MPGSPKQNLAQVLRLEVPLIVRVAQREMVVSEVTALSQGSIIELPKYADEDLEVLVNNTLIGTGQAVKVGENFGVRLTFIGTASDRAAAQASAAAADSPLSPDADAEAEALAAQFLAGQ